MLLFLHPLHAAIVNFQFTPASMVVTEGAAGFDVCISAASVADTFDAFIPASNIMLGFTAASPATLSGRSLFLNLQCYLFILPLVGRRDFLPSWCIAFINYFAHSVDFIQLPFGAGLSFSDAAPQGCISFQLLDDAVQEDTESFTVTFQPPTGIQFQLIGSDTVTVTILDDDGNNYC